jgi:flagellar protein FliS
MYPKNGTNVYQQVNVSTAEPGKLVIMCYDGASSSLRLAREHYENNEYEAKAKNLQKAFDIIGELEAALDFEKGGDVALNLKKLYQYIVRRLIDGDLKRDLQAFDESIGILDELASAWREIARGPRQETEILPQVYEQLKGRPVMAGSSWRG